ncbi:conserved hypothetical protein [Vibrio crassostreae]|nr:conserved hypothetical protein [Vibrio crassostreae]CAK2375410.1 conserved hypothetical protein [Vibrio crassostreae]
MSHIYYSVRTGANKNAKGFQLSELRELFLRSYEVFKENGYFDEAFGYYCVDEGDVTGLVQDIELEILLKIRKKNLWPPTVHIKSYQEDDLLDFIEFLYQHVSKPIDGTHHSWGDCGMHWETFNKKEGQLEFAIKINELLSLYHKAFELHPNGYILEKAEAGFEHIFKADIPTNNKDISSRLESSILSFRRHGATLTDRRNAVRDLSDVLEYLRPKVKSLFTKKDEKDLFEIANNFGIRHHNDKQKTDYDNALWLSWMFYFYLSTIHVLLRKIERDKNKDK